MSASLKLWLWGHRSAAWAKHTQQDGGTDPLLDPCLCYIVLSSCSAACWIWNLSARTAAIRDADSNIVSGFRVCVCVCSISCEAWLVLVLVLMALEEMAPVLELLKLPERCQLMSESNYSSCWSVSILGYHGNTGKQHRWRGGTRVNI